MINQQSQDYFSQTFFISRNEEKKSVSAIYIKECFTCVIQRICDYTCNNSIVVLGIWLNIRRTFISGNRPHIKFSIRSNIKFSIRPDIKFIIRPDIKCCIRPDIKFSIRPDIKFSIRQNIKFSIWLDIKYCVRPDIRQTVNLSSGRI